MRLFRAMFAVLLALAWAPLTAHCQLEHVLGTEWLQCPPADSPSSDESSHCGDSSCCAWESGAALLPQSKPEQTLPALSVPILTPILVESPGAAGASIESACGAVVFARPWQFLLRTALPVRAPSIVS